MSIRRELRQSLMLATPIIVSQLGMMLMNLVDTIVVGKVSAAALAGVGAGSGMFWMCVISGIGVLTALDALISQAHGANDVTTRDRYFVLGHLVAVGLSLILTPLLYFVSEIYYLIGATEDVLAVAVPFLQIMSINIPLVLITTVYQRYWQARNIALPMALIVIAANILNYYGNVALVLGEWGFPRLEAIGSAYATTLSRFSILVAIILFSWFYRDSPLRHGAATWRNTRDFITAHGWWPAHKPILAIGMPAGMQMLLEVAAFSIATTLATRLGAIDLAAHHIALMIASFTFMFPMGFAAAASVRVGQEVGARYPAAASRAGWFGVAQGAIVMLACSVILFVWPRTIFGWFTTDPNVVRRGLDILFLAAMFQVFDGVQVAAAGALRGLGKTRGPMFANLIGHYPIGLLTGIILCFYWDLGLVGLWLGLSLGLFVVATLNLGLWHIAARKLIRVF